MRFVVSGPVSSICLPPSGGRTRGACTPRGPNFFLNSGSLRIVGVLRLLLGVQVVEVAEELVEAVHGGQDLVVVAQMVLAELAGGIALRLEELGDGRVLRLQAERRARHADLGQAGADRRLPGDERRAAGGAALLAIPVGEQRAFFGDAVDVGRLVAHDAAVVGADVELADVVAPDDEDVGLLVAAGAGDSAPSTTSTVTNAAATRFNCGRLFIAGPSFTQHSRNQGPDRPNTASAGRSGQARAIAVSLAQRLGAPTRRRGDPAACRRLPTLLSSPPHHPARPGYFTQKNHNINCSQGISPPVCSSPGQPRLYLALSAAFCRNPCGRVLDSFRYLREKKPIGDRLSSQLGQTLVIACGSRVISVTIDKDQP